MHGKRPLGDLLYREKIKRMNFVVAKYLCTFQVRRVRVFVHISSWLEYKL